jgi:hypothetical protein
VYVAWSLWRQNGKSWVAYFSNPASDRKRGVRENVRSVGKLSDFGGCEMDGVGHGEPIPHGDIEVLNKLRELKV